MSRARTIASITRSRMNNKEAGNASARHPRVSVLTESACLAVATVIGILLLIIYVPFRALIRDSGIVMNFTITVVEDTGEFDACVGSQGALSMTILNVICDNNDVRIGSASNEYRSLMTGNVRLMFMDF